MQPNTTQHTQMIEHIQHRANKHGFALAMRDTPTAAAQIHRAARALDDIITDMPPRRQRINYVIGSTTVNGRKMKVLKPTTPYGETRILPADNPYLS